MDWPTTPDELIAEQERLAAARPAPWSPPEPPYAVGGCFLCSPRRQPGEGDRGDRCWAGAALLRPNVSAVSLAVVGEAGHPYATGLLALREGALLAAAVLRLPDRPAVLLVNATGRDHPRRAGLALHLGAVLDLPTVGVTHRPLLASGPWPPLERGASAPLALAGETVGHWLCTRTGTRPLAVHAAWRTAPDPAREIVLRAATAGGRTPEPIRLARRAARTARAGRGPAQAAG